MADPLVQLKNEVKKVELLLTASIAAKKNQEGAVIEGKDSLRESLTELKKGVDDLLVLARSKDMNDQRLALLVSDALPWTVKQIGFKLDWLGLPKGPLESTVDGVIRLIRGTAGDPRGSIPFAALSCSACKSPAGTFVISSAPTGIAVLEYHGTIEEKSLHPVISGFDAMKLMAALKKKTFKVVDELTTGSYFSGMDCYCKECDKVYCDKHMKKEKVQNPGAGYAMADESWWTTCPKRHKREVFHYYSLT